MMIVLTLGRLRASHIRPWKVWLAGQKSDNDLWFASTVYKNHQEAISVLLGFLEVTLRRAITSSERVSCGRLTSSEFELLRGYVPAIYQMDLVIFGLSFLFIPPATSLSLSFPPFPFLSPSFHSPSCWAGQMTSSVMINYVYYVCALVNSKAPCDRVPHRAWNQAGIAVWWPRGASCAFKLFSMH